MKQILIVDDQPEVRELVSVTLEASPYTILTAETGHEALAIIARDKPDMILLDVMMPNSMDGLEVCRLIKSDPATRSLYVIMLTAKGQEADREAGYAAGADDYFVKPFSPLALIVKIEQVLG